MASIATTVCILCISLATIYPSSCGCSDDECRNIEFKEPVANRAMKNHVIRSEEVPNEGTCRLLCYMEPNCVSINLGPLEGGKHKCELNNATNENKFASFLVDKPSFTFLAIENPCSSSPCLNNGTCQAGFTSKGFRCICRAGFTGTDCSQDIDECSNGSHECDTNAHCFNTVGGHNCTCKEGYTGDGRSCLAYKNCAEIYKSGERRDGVYTIKPDNLSAFDVFCDQTTAGGRWTVFQKRLDGSVDFYLNWNDYKHGFGDLSGEFWLGNDKIHRLTSGETNMLRVDLEDFKGNTAYAEYDMFGVMSENDKYKLTLGSYSGTANDSLSYHRDQPFTTRDQDNDSKDNRNCAMEYHGAWWYIACHVSNLNGIYRHANPPFPLLMV
ncbi:hypothetical protein ACROYT_G011221 [Oculina patagonica]